MLSSTLKIRSTALFINILGIMANIYSVTNLASNRSTTAVSTLACDDLNSSLANSVNT
jgi:hypothetical protein